MEQQTRIVVVVVVVVVVVIDAKPADLPRACTVPHQVDYDHDYDNDNEKLDATAQMLGPKDL
jgi:hypothetical protein